MLKRRLIPVLFLKDGWMVRSESFEIHQIIGSPMSHVQRMVEWDVDELIVLDISADDSMAFSHIRDDYRHRGASGLIEFIHEVANLCRIPLALGGRVRTLSDVRTRIQNGADKVVVNKAALETPELVGDIARSFGAQAVVVSIDYRSDENPKQVYSDFGQRPTGVDLIEHCLRMQDNGAGEIFLTALDRDGRACGYDIETIQQVVEATEIPIICCGGAGHVSHFRKCYEQTDVAAVAAGNIFHFTENAYPRAKLSLRTARSDIR